MDTIRSVTLLLSTIVQSVLPHLQHTVVSLGICSDSSSFITLDVNHKSYSRYYCNEIRFWLKCFPFSLGFLWFPILECSITCLNFLEHSCFFGGLHIWTPIHALALLLDSLVCYICLVCVFFAKFSHHHTCSFRVSSVIS